MREALKGLHKSPNNEMSVMFLETDTFPKEYYFITSNNAFLSKVKSKCQPELLVYPSFSKDKTNYIYLGNKDLFPLNEK